LSHSTFADADNGQSMREGCGISRRLEAGVTNGAARLDEQVEEAHFSR